jgi:hypothetical protein
MMVDTQPHDVAASDPQACEINRNDGGRRVSSPSAWSHDEDHHPTIRAAAGSQGPYVVHVVSVTTTRRGFRSEIDLEPDDAHGLSVAQCRHVPRSARGANRLGARALSALSIGYPTSPMVPRVAGWRTMPVMV